MACSPNFGVVTKMGFWLMPEPEAGLTGAITAPRHDDIVPLVELFAEMLYRGLIQSQATIVSPVMMDFSDPELSALRFKPGGASAQELDAYAQARKLPFWSLNFTLYGPPQVIQAQWDYLRGRFSAIDGAAFSEDARFAFPLSDDEVDKVVDKTVLGIPNLALFATRSGADAPPLEGHMDFSPVVPMTGAAVLEALNVFGKILHEAGITPLGGLPASYHTRAMNIIYAIPTGRDPETNKTARETFAKLIDAAAERGWGEYRVHPAVMKQAVGAYSYNNHALHRLHETLKDAIDPNGIISAGRYEIWPRHLRESKA